MDWRISGLSERVNRRRFFHTTLYFVTCLKSAIARFEKPVATPLAEAQASEIGRSRAPSLGSVRVRVRPCVCAPLPPICEGIESHQPEACAQISL